MTKVRQPLMSVADMNDGQSNCAFSRVRCELRSTQRDRRHEIHQKQRRL